MKPGVFPLLAALLCSLMASASLQAADRAGAAGETPASASGSPAPASATPARELSGHDTFIGAIGDDLSWDSNFPGGLAIVRLPAGISGAKASFNGRQVLTVPIGSGTAAVIGLDTDVEPGTRKLSLALADGQIREVPFTVVDRSYPTVKFNYPRKYHSYDEPTLERILREKKRLGRLKKTHSATAPDLGFVWPSTGRLSSLFGNRRVFQNRTSVHSGLDIANIIGTNVIASSGGVVLSAYHYYFTGKTVLIDHGSGVLSLYSHLDDFVVEDGETVAKGQLIGHIGNTGRSTGPHLHLSVGFNGSWIDPLVVLPERE